MESETLIVAVNETESVTAMLYPAAKNKRVKMTVVLGHGAGANQLSAFMCMIAGGLAVRGFDAATFNFLYTEQGRKIPDPKARLEGCYLAVIAAVQKHPKLKTNRLAIGGKSMGGRIASQVAATNEIDLAGLVFLGYPLHPPGRPEKLRAEHLKDVRAPMLFVQGARDAFGRPEELREIIKTFRVKAATVYAIEGGDHSLKVPKSAGVPQSEVYETVMDEIAKWLLSR